MLQMPVNGYDMPYLELGRGDPLVCLHGSLCDFRIWSPVMGLLSQQGRLVVPSLRHCFPAHWDGKGTGYGIAQHVDDVIGFIGGLGEPVHLLGHSRGGHVAFRVAQGRPDLLRSLILAEPGGMLDASLAPDATPPAASVPPYTVTAAAMITAGDVEGAMQHFVDAIDRPGTWRHLPEADRQQTRDNALTLLGQQFEGRNPYGRSEAEGIVIPTLLIGGERTTGRLPVILRALASHIPGAQCVMLPEATHMMFRQSPVTFSAAVMRFIESTR